MGKVDFGGVVKDVCLAYLPGVGVGDYAIVHVGFAISRIDEASAQETLRTFAQLGLLEEELAELRAAEASESVESAKSPGHLPPRTESADDSGNASCKPHEEPRP